MHGQDRHYHYPRIGVNGRLDTLQAAILLAKLDIFPEEVDARQRIGARYTELLSDAVTTPYISPMGNSVFAQYSIQVDDRVRVQQCLKKSGVPTAVHYPAALNRQPALADDKRFEHSEHAAARVISLPMHPYLSDEQIRRIADAINCCVDYSV